MSADTFIFRSTRVKFAYSIRMSYFDWQFQWLLFKETPFYIHTHSWLRFFLHHFHIGHIYWRKAYRNNTFMRYFQNWNGAAREKTVECSRVFMNMLRLILQGQRHNNYIWFGHTHKWECVRDIFENSSWKYVACVLVKKSFEIHLYKHEEKSRNITLLKMLLSIGWSSEFVTSHIL